MDIVFHPAFGAEKIFFGYFPNQPLSYLSHAGGFSDFSIWGTDLPPAFPLPPAPDKWDRSIIDPRPVELDPLVVGGSTVRWPCLLVKNCPCQDLRCVVAMLASELLRLPAFKLSRLSCEVVMFVFQVPQLSGFKLWGGHLCLQYLPQVEMCGCLLLKCCVCHGFKLWCGYVCFWNIVPATGLSAAKVLRLPPA